MPKAAPKQNKGQQKMKTKILIAALIVSASFTAQAEPEKLCSRVAFAAQEFMGARQAGMDLMDIIPTIEDGAKASKSFTMLRTMMINAFEYPVMPDEIGKARVISEFKNKYTVACLRGQ